MLYERYVLDTVSFSGYRFIANLGPFTDMKERARNGSCIVCRLILHTIQQDEQAWRKWDPASLVRILHISRVAEHVPFICHSKVRKIAGGTFKQLRVMIGNVDVCELLYAHSVNADTQRSSAEGLQTDMNDLSVVDEAVADLDMTPSVEDAPPPYDAKQHRMSDSAGDNFRWFERLSKRRQINFDTIRFWINNCQERHKGEFQYESDEDEFHILLLDVQAECLVPATTSDRYLALSYRWGEKPRDKMLLSNFQNQGTSALPQGVQDAMTLARSIGERYLWVDTLCM